MRRVRSRRVIRQSVPKGLENIQVKVISPPVELPDKAWNELRDGGKREDKFFRLSLQINNAVVPCEAHLIRYSKAGKPMKGWEPAWSVSIRCNIEVGSEFGDECLECNGCRGRSGPIRSGDTRRAISPAVLEAFKALGYEISHKYVDPADGIFSLFKMQVGPAEDLGVAHGRFGAFPTIGTKQRVCCPVHGSVVQKDMEAAV